MPVKRGQLTSLLPTLLIVLVFTFTSCGRESENDRAERLAEVYPVEVVEWTTDTIKIHGVINVNVEEVVIEYLNKGWEIVGCYDGSHYHKCTYILRR